MSARQSVESRRAETSETVTVDERRRTLLFVNIIISCVASSMLATALTTALPSIMRDLSLDVSTGQWLTSGYSLAMGICMPLTAFLITRFPTRRLYLSAIAVFIAGSVVAVLAPSFPVMMVGRVLQACGNGILSSMAQVILLTIYPAEKRGSIMGWYGLSVGAAPVIAPTIAGVLVDTLGWRWVFYLAILIMVVSLVWAIAVFADVLPTKRLRFDVTSFVLSAFAFGGITLGLGNVSAYGLGAPAALAPLVIGAVTGSAFARRQLTSAEPFLNLRILGNRTFALSVIGSMLLYLVMMGSSVIMPLYVQNIMGLSATTSGLVTLPGSLAMAVISPFAGRIYDALGMKRLFIAGAACMLASNIGMALIGLDTPIVAASALNTVRSISIGCLMMPLVTWGLSGVDTSGTAHGTALVTSFRTIAGAVGSALFVGIMNAVTVASPRSGAVAAMEGMSTTFIAMSVGATALLCIAVFLVPSRRHNARR